MAVYCSNCGTELNENDRFCGKCGATVVQAGGSKKGGRSDAEKHKIIGIAVIAVVVLATGCLVLKGIGGWKKANGNSSGPIMAVEDETPEEDEVLAHLRPWMGEWMLNYVVDHNQPWLIFPEHEGSFRGHILAKENGSAEIHVNEQYIDFTDLTKDQKDRIPVSALTYYESAYGADVFEDTDSGRRILFYKHLEASNVDYGEVMRIEAYVGMVEPEVVFIGDTPLATNHHPDSEGWAADQFVAFVRTDE